MLKTLSILSISLCSASLFLACGTQLESKVVQVEGRDVEVVDTGTSHWPRKRPTVSKSFSHGLDTEQPEAIAKMITSFLPLIKSDARRVRLSERRS